MEVKHKALRNEVKDDRWQDGQRGIAVLYNIKNEY